MRPDDELPHPPDGDAPEEAEDEEDEEESTETTSTAKTPESSGVKSGGRTARAHQPAAEKSPSPPDEEEPAATPGAATSEEEADEEDDEETTEGSASLSPPEETAPAEAPQPTPKKSTGRTRRARRKPVAEPAKTTDEKEEEDVPKAPRRPTLDPEHRRLLLARTEGDKRRPRFVREQTYRYFTLERRGSWRAPRGVQSKQRRHYGYRPQVVRVGYRSPALVRGLTPVGFRPIVIRTQGELERLNVATDAAILARTLGTRKRLILEEAARKLGVKVLNPIVGDRAEE
ncbi:MAG: 50S ribosomal protein L32e [Thermoplasmata archaeon]